MNIFTPSKLERNCIVVIGKESTGKSQLIASLTGQSAHSANFRGSTVTCDTYQSEAYTFIDTPGILYRSDSVTTKKALRQLQENDTVLLIVKATDVDRDLADLLPLVADKKGIVVITFWDKVFSTFHTQQIIREWTETSNLSIVTVDARHITIEQKNYILASLQEPHPFPAQWIPARAGWYIEPHPTLTVQLDIKIINLDGKSTRGSYDREAKLKALHSVSAWAAEHHLVLARAAGGWQI